MNSPARHIASCSFGKDSLATVILAREHGEPLDAVVYCEVMFDRGISGEVPEHRDFIQRVAIPKLRTWGIPTVTIHSPQTYVEKFCQVIARGKRVGKIWSWPLCGRCYVQRDLKLRPMEWWARTAASGRLTQYVGMAKEEEVRLGRMRGYHCPTVSLLEKYGVDEEGAKELCQRYGLLSPVYEFANRGGCFFCPNAKERELRHLYDHHPELWGRLLELQQLPNKVTERFNRKLRLDEIDAGFRLDDAQLRFWGGRQPVPFHDGWGLGKGGKT